MTPRTRAYGLAGATIAAALGAFYAGYLALFDSAERAMFAEAIAGADLTGAKYDPVTRRTPRAYNGSRPGVGRSGEIGAELLIAQRQGLRVSRVRRDGTIAWTAAFAEHVVGMELIDNRLFVATLREVAELDPDSGSPLWRRPAPYLVSGIGPGPDRLVILPMAPDQDMLGLDLAAGDTTAPARFDPAPATGTLGARHVQEAGTLTVLAHSMAGTVEVRDTATGAARRFPSTFPAQVQLTGDGGALIVEEHANRIVRLDLATGARTTVLSCPAALFRDAANGPEAVLDGSPATAADSGGARSVCDSALAPAALYSPNGFYAAADGTIYVADTDNHRVAVFDAATGALTGEITGLNGPIRVIPLGEQQ